MLRVSLAFMTCFLFILPAYAKEYKLFVSNEHIKPITIETAAGEKITLQPHERLTNTFRSGTTIKNYVEGKFVCDWYIPKESPGELLGLVYGWYGNHPSKLGCTILVNI